MNTIPTLDYQSTYLSIIPILLTRALKYDNNLVPNNQFLVRGLALGLIGPHVCSTLFQSIKYTSIDQLFLRPTVTSLDKYRKMLVFSNIFFIIHYGL